MKESRTLDLLCKMLVGIELSDPKAKRLKSSYTLNGCEAFIEYWNVTYRISVEPIEPIQEESRGTKTAV